ncbi:hypothetical protein ACFLQR_05345 [Verrucomicrobiota bacterium]
MKTRCLILLSILSIAVPAWACEPVVPLAVLYAGEFSLAIIAHSVPFLFAVVGVKCAAFIWFSRRLLPWYKAILLMVIANVVSTLIGIVASIPFAVPIFLIGIIPLVFGLSLFPARRYSRWLSDQFKNPIQPRTVAWIVTLMFIGSTVLFFLATGLVEHSSRISLWWYWLVKIVYVYIALLLSTGLTIYIEDGTISSLAKQTNDKQTPYLAAVARANLLALLLITIVGAIKTLPARLASPDFLISW